MYVSNVCIYIIYVHICNSLCIFIVSITNGGMKEPINRVTNKIKYQEINVAIIRHKPM